MVNIDLKFFDARDKHTKFDHHFVQVKVTSKVNVYRWTDGGTDGWTDGQNGVYAANSAK